MGKSVIGLSLQRIGPFVDCNGFEFGKLGPFVMGKSLIGFNYWNYGHNLPSLGLL